MCYHRRIVLVSTFNISLKLRCVPLVSVPTLINDAFNPIICKRIITIVNGPFKSIVVSLLFTVVMNKRKILLKTLTLLMFY